MNVILQLEFELFYFAAVVLHFSHYATRIPVVVVVVVEIITAETGDISTLEGTPLKLVDKFTYLGSSVESTEKDIEKRG